MEHSDLDTRLAVWHSNTAHITPMVALDRDPIDTRKIQYTPHGHRTTDMGEPAMFYGRPPIIATGTWVHIAHLLPQDTIAVRNDDGSYSDHLRYTAQYAGLIGMAVRPSKEMDAFDGTINTPNGVCCQNVCIVLFGCSGSILSKDGTGVNSNGRENIRPAVMFHVRILEPVSHSEVEDQFRLTADQVDDAFGGIERAPHTMYACTCGYMRESNDGSVSTSRLVHSICCIDYNRHTYNSRYPYNGLCIVRRHHRHCDG